MKKFIFNTTILIVSLVLYSNSAYAAGGNAIANTTGQIIGILILPTIIFFIVKKTQFVIIGKIFGVIFILVSVGLFIGLSKNSGGSLIGAILFLISGIILITMKKKDKKN